MALTVLMGYARSGWKAKCCGGGRSRWKPGRPCRSQEDHVDIGLSGGSREELGRMDGVVVDVSQELSLDLERRVATEVVY